MNINSKIATLILRAQNASDGGKNMDYLVNNKRSYRDNCAGYGQKDVLIMNALRLISSNRTSFKFSVQRDREGCAEFLVYFETRINFEKYQVSFHSFDRRLNSFVGGFRMKWDHGVSRESACIIYDHYVCHGEYLGGDAV